jgi:hypothetical protein
MRRGFVRGAQRAVAWCAAALFAFVVLAFPGPVAATPAVRPTPSHAPAVKPRGNTPGLDVSVQLGSVHVNLNVPLDLGPLLGGTKKQTPTPTPTRSAPTKVTPTSRAASRPAPVHSHAAAAGHVAAYPPTPPHLTHTATPPRKPTSPAAHRRHRAAHHASHHATHHHPKSRTAADPRVVFATGHISGSGAVVLVLLCVVCGIGVAVVVRLSGGRRRL